MSKTKFEPITVPPITSMFASLRDLLRSTREAFEAPSATKSLTVWWETVASLDCAVRSFVVRAPKVRNDDDLLLLRSELAEMLRSAASAIAPRAT